MSLTFTPNAAVTAAVSSLGELGAAVGQSALKLSTGSRVPNVQTSPIGPAATPGLAAPRTDFYT